MKAGRTRYLLLGDIKADSLRRLYGTLGIDALFEVQSRFDELIATNVGAACRITAPGGTDIAFRLDKKPGGMKTRRVDRPGTSTVMGSCVFYPEPDSMRGVIALDAVFHEYYAVLRTPIRLEIDGEIRKIDHVREHEIPMERALRRASNGGYGRVIHLTCGFHPAARFSGRSFIEDIRSIGANAIGLGSRGGSSAVARIIRTASCCAKISGSAARRSSKNGRIVGPDPLARVARDITELDAMVA
ncbi:MAG: hypothetical protein WDO24_28910 [Pseudomonadota bacterium]